METEQQFRKIEYFKKSDLDLSKFKNIEPRAKALIDESSDDTNLVLRLGVNSPVCIEAAALLSKEGIREVTKV